MESSCKAALVSADTFSVPLSLTFLPAQKQSLNGGTGNASAQDRHSY